MESTANHNKLFGTPERYSLLWNILLHTVLRPWLHVWYKRITITGRENIPQGKPIIFAPNHQNGIIDPLLVLAASRRQIVWLATADYFKNKLLVICSSKIVETNKLNFFIIRFLVEFKKLNPIKCDDKYINFFSEKV